MYERLLNKYGINQAGYYVEDLEEAARSHAALFGSGPFIYMDPMTQTIDFRGEKHELTMQTAYGQLGDIQIELIQVLSDGPSPYKESGRYGFHHFSIWVDDLEAALKEFAEAGFEVAMRFESGGGLQVAYVDCRDPWGYYIELHAPIERFWDMIKQAAEAWDGKDPYRRMGA